MMVHAVERIPEPEIMDSEEQVRAYAQADFSEPNAAFIARIRALWPDLPPHAKVVDLGCGPAHIPITLALHNPGWRIDAVDGSPTMLAHARQAVRREQVARRVRLVRAMVGKRVAAYLPAATYHLITSNSLLHHLHDPSTLWATIKRIGGPGTKVLVMDLTRPSSDAEARRLVDTYAADEPEILRRDFLASLRAAHTVDEVRAQLDAAGLHSFTVERTSDRHLMAFGSL